ncbi:MAG: stage V sporulation protein AE [Clostridia bacterium]|nr:stage V sporulation protein AE [Clostridia bacterium]
MNYLWAFLVGGFICLIGQILIDKTKLTPAKILVGFVCIGVLLGAVGVYDKIIDFASSGATVPISGFGALLARGTREAVDKDGLLGAFTGPLTAGSAGIMAAVLSGLILSFMTRPKPR